MKKVKVLREAYIYGNHIKLCYMIKCNEQRQDFTSLSRDVFPSLVKEEIEEIFKEKLNDIAMIEEFWNGIEISIKAGKEKEEIKETHKRIMKVLKEIIKELTEREKKKSLEKWLWHEKEIEI